jgi:hypothetical protein
MIDARDAAARLAQAWADADEGRAYADERALFRHSNATNCSRALYYEVNGVESEAPDLAGHWVMGLGRLVHDHWQQSVITHYKAEGWTVSEEVTCYIEECRSAGHADLMLERDGERGVVELKTVNGTGFRQCHEKNKPRFGALVQGALNAYALDADWLLIIYLAMEAMSPGNASRMGLNDPRDRFVKTFAYERPAIEATARVEIARWAALVEREGPPPRTILDDDGSLISVIDPLNATTLGGGKTWRCDYCRYRRACIDDFLQEHGL